MECADICNAVVSLLYEAGEENMASETYGEHGELLQHKVCSNLRDSIDHRELLRRLSFYKLTRK